MQGYNRTLVNPPVSSREAFAALDAKNDRLASELPGPVELSAQDLIGEHQGTGYEKPEPVVIPLNASQRRVVISTLKLYNGLPSCFELADDAVIEVVIRKP